MKTSIKKMKLEDLIPTENNPRQIKKDDFERLKKSVQSFPQMLDIREIVVDENNRILGGHQRVKALLANGEKEVNVKVVEGLSEEEKREFVIRDNIQNGEWDFDVLANEWDDLPLDDWGIELPIADIEEEIVEDEAPEPPAEPKSKLGEIYQLGEHRLMCGDSTNAEQVAELMDGEKADMVFTDPPYNLQTKGGCRGSVGKSLKKQGKDIEFIADFDPSDFLSVLPIVFSGNMNAYIFCNKELLPDYLNWCKDSGYSWNVLVWKKPNAIPIGDSHRPDIEYLLLFRKNALWNNGTDANYSRCLQYDRVKKSDENGNHPTLKPVELIVNELKISSNKNSVVVDFFGGSGSTLIACEQTGRKCYMMELDPHYVDVIIERWENLTGKKAERIQ